MAVEYNNIVYDNVATPKQNAYDNVAQSDELNVPLPDNDGKMTLYARNKRAKKVVHSVAVTATIMISVGGSGVLLWNSFFPKPAAVSNVSFSLEARTFNYSFDITKADKYNSYFALYTGSGKNTTEFFIVDVTAGGKFEGSTNIPNYIQDGSMFTAEIYGANAVDYRRTYHKQTFTVTIATQSQEAI